jgi:hypothetical protein
MRERLLEFGHGVDNRLVLLWDDCLIVDGMKATMEQIRLAWSLDYRQSWPATRSSKPRRSGGPKNPPVSLIVPPKGIA